MQRDRKGQRGGRGGSKVPVRVWMGGVGSSNVVVNAQYHSGKVRHRPVAELSVQALEVLTAGSSPEFSAEQFAAERKRVTTVTSGSAPRGAGNTTHPAPQSYRVSGLPQVLHWIRMWDTGPLLSLPAVYVPEGGRWFEVPPMEYHQTRVDQVLATLHERGDIHWTESEVPLATGPAQQALEAAVYRKSRRLSWEANRDGESVLKVSGGLDPEWLRLSHTLIARGGRGTLGDDEFWPSDLKAVRQALKRTVHYDLITAQQEKLVELAARSPQGKRPPRLTEGPLHLRTVQLDGRTVTQVLLEGRVIVQHDGNVEGGPCDEQISAATGPK